MVRWLFMCATVALPVVALGGTPRVSAPVVDAPSDTPASPSHACAPSGRPCARVEGEALRFHDGVVHDIPVGVDRLVVAEDRWVAFVAPREGLPSVHVLSPAGEVKALTNLDLVRTPGRAPEGFVPPPVREGDLRLEGSAVAWTLPAGQEVRIEVPEMASRGTP